MSEILTADYEHRGLILDPRTKLAAMLMIVIFALGGVGSNLKIMNIVVGFLALLPIVLMFTSGKWKRALIYGGVYICMLMLELFGIDKIGGSLQVLSSIFIITVIRLLPGLMMGTYILNSTTVSEFVAAMNRMHLPQQITIPLSVMFRFIPTVTEEFAAINAAMKMREISLFGKNRAKFVEYRIIPLLVCSANIGSDLSAAALTRGLTPDVKRTNICRIGFHIQDILVFVITLIPFMLLILGRAGVIH